MRRAERPWDAACSAPRAPCVTTTLTSPGCESGCGAAGSVAVMASESLDGSASEPVDPVEIDSCATSSCMSRGPPAG